MIDTVLGHLESGAIHARSRVTVDDLDMAATWLEAYEGNSADDQANLVALATVAAYLRRLARRRESRQQPNRTREELTRDSTPSDD